MDGRKKTQHIGVVSVKELLEVVEGRCEGGEKKFSRVSNIQYLEPNQLRATSTGNYKGKGWDATSRRRTSGDEDEKPTNQPLTNSHYWLQSAS